MLLQNYYYAHSYNFLFIGMTVDLTKENTGISYSTFGSFLVILCLIGFGGLFLYYNLENFNFRGILSATTYSSQPQSVNAKQEFIPQQIAFKSTEVPLNVSLPLPSHPKPFVGRKSTIKQIKQHLLGSQVSIIGLFGPPAFGKSSLAVYVAHEIRNNKGINVHYVDLNEFRLSFEGQVQFNSDARDLQLHSGKSEKETSRTVNGDHLLNWASGIEGITILVLDNCDSVLNESQDKFQELLLSLKKSSRGNLKIVITSQKKISFVDNFKAFEVTELSEKEAKSLFDELHQDISDQHKTKIAELVGNCPLAIKVAAVLLKTINPVRLIYSLEQNGIDAISSSRFPRPERFTVVMNTACQDLTNDTRRAAYFFSLFPGSFDENILLCSMFKEYDKEINILFERSLFERQVHGLPDFGERYKLHKLIQEFFRQKILESMETKLYFKFVFKQKFIYYYTDKFYDHLCFLKSITELSLKDQHFLFIEQHNLRHLTILLLKKRASCQKLISKEKIIILFAYRQGILQRNQSIDVLEMALELVEEKTELNKICSLANFSLCPYLISDLMYSTAVATNTDYAHLPCTIWKVISGPKQFHFLSENFTQQLIENSFIYCMENMLSHFILKCSLDFLFLPFLSIRFFKYYKIILCDFNGYKPYGSYMLYYMLPFLGIIAKSSSIFYSLMIFNSLLFILLLLFWNRQPHNITLLMCCNRFITVYLFFVGIFYSCYFGFSVLENVLGYLSLEGNGSIMYKKWCRFCVYFTSTNSVVVSYLYLIVCSFIYPGFPIMIVFPCFRFLVELAMERFHLIVYTIQN